MSVIDSSCLWGRIPGATWDRNIGIRPMDEVSRAQEQGVSSSSADDSVYGRSTPGLAEEYEM